MLKNRFLLLSAVAMASLMAASCATPGTESRNTATYENATSLPLNVARVGISSTYNPSSDPKDISLSYPVQPDAALRSYATKRLQATGGSDSLKFVIEDASVHHNFIKSPNSVGDWLGVGAQDEYIITVRLRIARESDMSAAGTDSVLNFKRSVTIPSSVSLANREKQQREFLDTLLQDIDKAVTDVVQHKMGIR